jgi:hypothetical protein
MFVNLDSLGTVACAQKLLCHGKQYAIQSPLWLIGACGFGAFFNPLAFLVRGLTPKAVATIAVEAHFPLQALLSFSLTTIGFLGSVLLVIRAVWRLRA